MPYALLVVFLIAVSNTTARQAPPEAPRAGAVAFHGGRVAPVSELDHRIRSVLQASDSAYWFGSGGHGAYRWDGKTLVRFTTAHGLSSNHVGGAQEDRAGNILVGEGGGVSRFDAGTGRFTKITPLDATKSEWRLGPDDLWFAAGQDTGAVFRWDGAALHRLTFPKTAAGDAATLPQDKYPNAKYSPYDVYTIMKDSKGRVWFGTAILGACRYDGKSFVWVGNGENGSFGTRGIVEVSEGRFWLSNTMKVFAEEPGGAGYRTEPGTGTGDDGFSTFVSGVRDKEGHLWLAIMGGAVYRYDGKTWTDHPVMHEGKRVWVNTIYRDRQDRIWVSSNEHGLYRLEGGKFERAKF